MPRKGTDSLCEGRAMATELSGRFRELERQLEAERRQHALEPPGHNFASAQDKMLFCAHRGSCGRVCFRLGKIWIEHAFVQALDAMVVGFKVNAQDTVCVLVCGSWVFSSDASSSRLRSNGFVLSSRSCGSTVLAKSRMSCNTCRTQGLRCS